MEEKVMPHYKDGTEAAIGDVVKGTGYNVKDSSGVLKEIVGTVVGITPGSASCNIQVAHVVTTEIDAALHEKIASNYRHVEIKGVTGCGAKGGEHGTPKVVATAQLEYGQCNHFVKVAVLLLAIGFTFVSSTASACQRCGLFGNRCVLKQVQAVHHAQAVVAAPIVYPSINYFVGAPVRVEALVQKALKDDPAFAEFQKFRQWQALSQPHTAPADKPAEQLEQPADVAVLKAKCATCHSGEKPKGSLLLDGTAPLSAEQALNAMRKIQDGSMPPPAKPRLTPEEAGDVFSSLLDLSQPKPGGDP